MFNPDALARLRDRHAPVLQGLAGLERQLAGRFHDLDEAARALCLAVLSGEPLLLIGPPGTAKSQLVRAFCERAGLVDIGGEVPSPDGYFEYLLTPFTEPGELFGFFDIARLHGGEGLHRIDDGQMQHARVVFLDEIFNASSAILNSLLTFINERQFHDRGAVIPVRMECLFAATNEIPRAAELRAVFDRFLLRSRVENVRVDVVKGLDNLVGLVSQGWSATYGGQPEPGSHAGLLDGAAALRADIRTLSDAGVLLPQPDPASFGNLAHLVRIARQYQLSDMSNRRLVKMIHVMVLNRLFRAAIEGDDGPLSLAYDEMSCFWRFFLDLDDHAVREKMAKLPFDLE